MNNIQTMTLIEAVETLSNIADLELNPNVGILKKVDDGHITFKTIEWLNEKEREEGLKEIKLTFADTLRFLQSFYQDEYRSVHNEKAEDRIKTVMVLVGEAAKKIDKYSKSMGQPGFHSVMDIQEYRSLQNFFQHNISRTVNEGTIGKWLLAITRNAWGKGAPSKPKNLDGTETSRIFVDLESVKNDTEYELFSLRKDDGSRFFSPRLIRNIKLISDFGDIFNKSKKGDLLSDLAIWKDRYLQQASKEIIKGSKSSLDLFYKEAYKHKDHPLVAILSHAIVALLLASNPHNLMGNVIKKCCSDYFGDFLMYLREALNHRDYQKAVIYAPKKEHTISLCLLKVIDSITYALYDHKGALDTMQPLVRQLLDEGSQEISHEHHQKNGDIWSSLASSGQAMAKVIKSHPNGPLNKVIQSIVEGHYNSFDPLSSFNIPYRIFSLFTPNKTIGVLRLPSPTIQETISKAEVTAEFRSFLRKDHKHLLIVLQDRTSWKECARAFALENLNETCPVITLPTDTEFYHQLSHYFDENSWKVFSENLLDQAGDLSAGYFFNPEMESNFEGFIPNTIECIHNLFFKNNQMLTREERMAFIDIFYLFITMKAISLSNPETLSFSCKDGIDTGNMFSLFLWTFFLLLEKDAVSSEKILQMESYLFGPALLGRERAPINAIFKRFIHAIRQLEKSQADLGKERYSELVKEMISLILDDNLKETHA